MPPIRSGHEERLQAMQGKVGQMGLERTHRKKHWSRRLRFWGKSRGKDKGHRITLEHARVKALAAKLKKGEGNIDASNAALAQAQRLAQEDPDDLVHQLMKPRQHHHHDSIGRGSGDSGDHSHGYIKGLFKDLGGAHGCYHRAPGGNWLAGIPTVAGVLPNIQAVHSRWALPLRRK